MERRPDVNNDDDMEEDFIDAFGEPIPLDEVSDNEDPEDDDNEEEDEEAEDDAPALQEDVIDQNHPANNQERQPYEISLPSRHEYLGVTEELSGRTVIEDHDLVTIPVLMLTGINLILLPSQTLPLTVFNPVQQSMLRNVIAKDRIIGIVHTEISHNDLVQYGTTAEIFEYQNTDSGSMSVKAKGRQRFRVISTHRELTGCMVAKVRILPEIRLTDPLSYVRLKTHCTMNMSNSCTDAGQSLQIRKKESLKPAKAWRARHRSALLTPWPSWVYDLYDEEQLALKLVNEIVSVLNIESKIQIPREPQELSHWASINLPLSDANRLSLLSLNSATQRLRYMLSVTDQTIKKSTLNCNYCRRKIAQTKDIFCMSIDGPQGTFVNPDGYVHEMVTVTEANGLRFIGEASTLHSWFPGYAWRIASCKTCHSHIGWMFKVSKLKTKPRSFYGLTRKSVKTNLTNEDNAVELQYISSISEPLYTTYII